MARGRRIKLPSDGACYHVMSRTVMQAFLFEDPAVREWIYRRIVWLSNIYFVDLLAVTVMNNHYHVVLKVRKPQVSDTEIQRRFEAYQATRSIPLRWLDFYIREWYAKLTDLSAFMKDLNQSIAVYINRKNQGKGAVWGGRYKSVLLEEDEALQTCMAYVELNPVRAKICASPYDYKWCSMGRFQQFGKQAAGVVTPPLPYCRVFSQPKQRQLAFYAFVHHLALIEAGEESTLPIEIKELEAFLRNMDPSWLQMVLRQSRWLHFSLVLGSKSFVEDCISQFHLQPSRPANPSPCPVGPGLFNGHQRHGPFG